MTPLSAPPSSAAATRSWPRCTGHSLRILLLLLAVLQDPSAWAASSCSSSPFAPGTGPQRLALVVGINDYQSPDIPDLNGAVLDAQRMASLLTSPTGYGFPEANVCLLLDREATAARFEQAFEQSLVSRARPEDTVVLYFAGHGAQLPDQNGDEPDALDETLVLADSRVGTVPELVDDHFAHLLERLYARTHHLTLILDSCSSGSAGRAGMLKVRSIPPQEAGRASPPFTGAGGDGGRDWQSPSMPELLVLSAAGDGSSALEGWTESGTGGMFTRALLQVLADASAAPLTWAQVEPRVRQQVAAESLQNPYFQGPLDQVVFEHTTRRHPYGWQVAAIDGDELVLKGLPMPGWERGAQVRIYPAASSPAALKDPLAALTQLELSEVRGLTARGRRSGADAARPISPGDLAVLTRPGDASLRLAVRLRPPREPGGIPRARAAAIRAEAQRDPDWGPAITWAEHDAELELMVGPSGRLALVDPSAAGGVRNTFDPEDPKSEPKTEPRAVVKALWQHARRKALLKLEGEGGALFTNNQTLQVRLVPYREQLPCARMPWPPMTPARLQPLPLCARWQIEVSLAAEAPEPLLVGGLLLANDGGLYGIPASGRQERLEPGSTCRLPDLFRATSPLNATDDLLIFGTRESEPVAWHRFTDPASTRDLPTEAEASPLARSLARYLQAKRDVVLEPVTTEGAWTSTHLSIRVEANSPITEPSLGAPPSARQYRIPHVDLRPYLPDRPDSALARLLAQADRLVQGADAGEDAAGPRDVQAAPGGANLHPGESSARALWRVFTSAGLSFSPGNAYTPMKQLLVQEGALEDSFDRCEASALRIGDILLYHDEAHHRGMGLLVIDPRLHIAWGSQAWDEGEQEAPQNGASHQEGGPVEPGVIYQRIRYPRDWTRLGLSSVTLAACWRHKRLAQEWATPAGQPGTLALDRACDREQCR